MAKALLPSHRWYECDHCTMPRLQARLTPKDLSERKVKCIVTPRCEGRMRGPIENPTGIDGWNEDNFIPERKKAVRKVREEAPAEVLPEPEREGVRHVSADADAA